MSKQIKVKGYKRSAPKSAGKVKVKSHTRSLPSTDLSFSKKDMDKVSEWILSPKYDGVKTEMMMWLDTSTRAYGDHGIVTHYVTVGRVGNSKKFYFSVNKDGKKIKSKEFTSKDKAMSAASDYINSTNKYGGSQ